MITPPSHTHTLCGCCSNQARPPAARVGIPWVSVWELCVLPPSGTNHLCGMFTRTTRTVPSAIGLGPSIYPQCLSPHLPVLQRQVLVGATVRKAQEAAGGGAEAEWNQPEESRLVPRTHTLGSMYQRHTHVRAFIQKPPGGHMFLSSQLQ